MAIRFMSLVGLPAAFLGYAGTYLVLVLLSSGDSGIWLAFDLYGTGAGNRTPDAEFWRLALYH